MTLPLKIIHMNAYLCGIKSICLFKCKEPPANSRKSVKGKLEEKKSRVFVIKWDNYLVYPLSLNLPHMSTPVGGFLREPFDSHLPCCFIIETFPAIVRRKIHQTAHLVYIREL